MCVGGGGWEGMEGEKRKDARGGKWEVEWGGEIKWRDKIKTRGEIKRRGRGGGGKWKMGRKKEGKREGKFNV